MVGRISRFVFFYEEGAHGVSLGIQVQCLPVLRFTVGRCSFAFCACFRGWCGLAIGGTWTVRVAFGFDQRRATIN